MRSESGIYFKSVDKSLKITCFSLSQRRSRSEWNVTICCDLIACDYIEKFKPVFEEH